MERTIVILKPIFTSSAEGPHIPSEQQIGNVVSVNVKGDGYVDLFLGHDGKINSKSGQSATTMPFDQSVKEGEFLDITNSKELVPATFYNRSTFAVVTAALIIFGVGALVGGLFIATGAKKTMKEHGINREINYL